MRAVKALGQNFLNSPSSVAMIMNAVKDVGCRNVLEIGPGTGALTIPLSTYAHHLVAVEKDVFLFNQLHTLEQLRTKNTVQIVNADILDIDADSYFDSPYIIVGSLPYNISKRILQKFLPSTSKKLEHMFVLVQKEVAQELCAQPPHASFLSNWTRIYADCTYVGTIRKTAFQPIPQVDGGFLHLHRHNFPADHLDYVNFLKVLFKQPRKTVFNNLRLGGIDSPYPPDSFQGAVQLAKRPAMLTYDELRSLYLML